MRAMHRPDGLRRAQRTPTQRRRGASSPGVQSRADAQRPVEITLDAILIVSRSTRMALARAATQRVLSSRTRYANEPAAYRHDAMREVMQPSLPRPRQGSGGDIVGRRAIGGASVEGWLFLGAAARPPRCLLPNTASSAERTPHNVSNVRHSWRAFCAGHAANSDWS